MYCYGVALNYEPAALPVNDLEPPAPRWRQPVHLHHRPGPAPAPDDVSWRLDSETAELVVPGVMRLTLERETHLGVIESPRPLDAGFIVHPLAAYVGTVVARWNGHSALHAAAVHFPLGAWLILGGPSSGKSTLTSEFGARGYGVLTDDLAVLAGSTVLAGPRTCDLRPESHVHLGRGEDVTALRRAPRYRTELGPAPASSTVVGVVVLSQGPRLTLRRLSPSEKLATLAAYEALNLGPARPSTYLDLMHLPFVELTRPLQWDALGPSVRAIERLAAGHD